jgi:hypothetical protein
MAGTMLLGTEVLTLVTAKNTIFWYVAPCILVDVHRHLRGIYCLCCSQGERYDKNHAERSIRVYCLAVINKTKAIRYSETSVNLYHTTRRHIPENNTLDSRCGENLNSD